MTIQEIKAISISGFLSSKGYEPANKKGYNGGTCRHCILNKPHHSRLT